MALIEYEQHLEEALTSMAPPWWGKPRIAALVASYVNRLQEVEDAIWEVIAIRELATADLPRLKILGAIIGQPRLLFTTEMYRKVLQARALANVSQGRARDIISVLEVLIGPGDYILNEVGNATLLLTITIAVDAEQLAALVQVLPDVRAAGIGFQVLFTDSPDDVFFFGDTWSTTTEFFGSVRTL